MQWYGSIPNLIIYLWIYAWIYYALASRINDSLVNLAWNFFARVKKKKSTFRIRIKKNRRVTIENNNLKHVIRTFFDMRNSFLLFEYVLKKKNSCQNKKLKCSKQIFGVKKNHVVLLKVINDCIFSTIFWNIFSITSNQFFFSTSRELLSLQ